MRRATFAIVLVCVLAVCGVGARAEESGKVTRVYPLQTLDPLRAQFELEVAYPAAAGMEMVAERTGEANYLRVVAPAADQEAIAKILAEKDVAPPAVSLQVILLEALDAPVPGPDLPGGAQNALKDVRSLFPFKGYRQRHTAVVPAARNAMASLGNEFGVRLDARPQGSGTVSVAGFELVRTLPEKAPVQLLGTSFSIKRGETVVLGTSLLPATAKADPDTPRALVVLVTALP